MRLLFFIFLIVFNVFYVEAQIISSDTVICTTFQGDLYAVGSNLSNMASDDSHDSIVDIGFPFLFYGNPYTKLVISGNGYITFDTTTANTYSPWAINTAIPNPGNIPQNAILAPWHDMNTGLGGEVSFGVAGIAPNRFFVVTWCQVPLFSCTGDLVTQQIILYEGSHKIEMFIQDKPLCAGWNGGASIQGLVDATSTNFDIVDDPILLSPRNFPLQWSATNEGWEFIPNGISSYTINQITYVPINVGVNSWLDASGNIIGQGPILNVNVDTTTVFYSQVSGVCYNITIQDSVIIAITDLDVDLGPDYNIPCNSTTLIDPTPTGGFKPYFYSWSNSSSDSTITVGGGEYILNLTDNYGCIVIDTVFIFEDPSPSFDFGLDVQIPCNTTILLDPQVTGGVEPYSYLWSTGSSESVINVDEGFYVLTVNDVFGCSDTDTIVVTEDPNPTTSISGGGILCADGTMANILFDYDGVLPWDLVFSDGSNSYNIDNIMSSTYTHTTFLAGQYTIDSSTDVNGCISNTSGSVDIIVNPLPEPVISPDNITIYIGDYVILELVEEYVNYEWYQIGNESVLNESSSITVTDTGTFYVWVEDVNGCTNLSDIAVVNTIPITQLYVPTTFTPNNDDHNELFVIQGINIVDFSIQIYSRWGQKVFESNTIEKSWDGYHEGKRIAEGSYYYHIEVLGEDDEIFEKTGEINVMY